MWSSELKLTHDAWVFCSQEHVVKEDLLSALYCEFINRVNEVGVDVNKAIAHPHTQSLVQYVCGLGPRKGSHLLKVHSVDTSASVALRLPLPVNLTPSVCTDSQAEQHAARKQNPAGHHVPHGAQGFHQLRRVHQD